MKRTPGSPLAALFGTTLAALAAYVAAAGCASSKPQGRTAAVDTYVHAVLVYQSGDRDKAIAALRDAVKQRDDLVMAHEMLGDLYQSKRDYAAALEEYKRTTKLDPYSASNYYNEGLMLHFLNRVQDAVAAYLRALKLNPEDFKTNLGLGAAYLSLNDPDDAVRYAKKATELDAKSAAAWSNYAVALDQLKRYPEAESAYRKALELDGSAVDTAVALAENLMRQKKYPEARSVMQAVVREADTAPHRKRLGDTYFVAAQYDDAIGEYRKALDLDKRYFPALNEMGWVLIAQYEKSMQFDDEKRTAALDAWRRSLLVNRNQPRIEKLMQAYEKRFSEDR